jgi:hypothetical protein
MNRAPLLNAATEPVGSPILVLLFFELFGQQLKEQWSQLGIAEFATDQSSETWLRARSLNCDVLPRLQVSFRLEPVVQVSSLNATTFQM